MHAPFPPRLSTACAALVAFALAACGEPPATSNEPVVKPGDSAPDTSAPVWPSGDLFPLAEGTRWTWRARSGPRTWTVVARKFGGDVREDAGGKVKYGFVYASLDDEAGEIMKSIYAQPAEGPQEFHLDFMFLRLSHTPPLPLLPDAPALDARWTWRGVLNLNRTKQELATTLQVVALERLVTPAGTYDAVRIDEIAEGLRISRWFVAGIGMARLEVAGTYTNQKVDFSAELTAFAPPR